MKISLGDRTAETVRIYFERAGTPEIRAVLPQKAKTVEEALEDYEKTLLPGAASYGRTIIADGDYIGDVWCYCIDPEEEPNAMVSYCVFEKDFRSKGIATEALSLFLDEIQEKFGLKTVGAFTFADNTASIKVLEKNGFVLAEDFSEDGRESKYFERAFKALRGHNG